MSWSQFKKDWKSLREIVFNRMRGQTHGERLESFYSAQADSYDEFRKRLLRGREDLLAQLPKGSSWRWIDFGAGTGSNLDLLSDDVPNFKKIYLVDLSPSLLKKAQARVQNKAWTNVEICQKDCLSFQTNEPVDLITFSYSLTMMPNWLQILHHAETLLRAGGLIAVVDFFVSRKYENSKVQHSALKRHFFKIWFEKDNVYLNPDHLEFLESQFERQFLDQRESALPYLPFLKVPYYLFVGKKREGFMDQSLRQNKPLPKEEGKSLGFEISDLPEQSPNPR